MLTASVNALAEEDSADWTDNNTRGSFLMKKSSRVALGGVIASLCVLLMMMTGFFPFLTYAAPLLSGFLLIAVVCDCGYQWSILVYLVVALLSVFVVPDKQAAMVFLFLGYYPILKDYLDHKMKPGLFVWLIKFVVFNLSMIAAYALMIYVFRMPDIMTEMGELGKWTGLVTLGAGNIVFLVFEMALNNVFRVYKEYFRPRILRKLK